MADARLTVVFPTYNAAGAVPGLVAGVAAQEPPEGAPLDSWLEVIFIDNDSSDDTVDRIHAQLAAQQLPYRVRVIRNEENLGLARSFNRALEAVETDYVLTCHADCRFASERYLASVIEILDANPALAVVSGQPIADVEGGLSRVEKVYLAANLMDIFPDGDEPLQPVGFAEGRCDGFKMQALRAAGFYDTTLRRAGEDQILSARLRALGYRVCRAPGLRYYLSVSSDQDSLLKLVRHANLFGRVHPYLLLAHRGTVLGISGEAAGRNRSIRAGLRLLQLAGAASSIWFVASIAVRRPSPAAAAAVVAVNVPKWRLFNRYVRQLHFEPQDIAALAALQPALDVAYTAGFIEGLWRARRGGIQPIA
jgi:glycosyltransferase involved in cell wall biosynthesis